MVSDVEKPCCIVCLENSVQAEQGQEIKLERYSDVSWHGTWRSLTFILKAREALGRFYAKRWHTWFTFLKLSFWLLNGWIIEEQEWKQSALLGCYHCSLGVKYGSRDDQRYILETELIGLVQGLDMRGETKRRIKDDSQIIWFKQLGREWSQLL